MLFNLILVAEEIVFLGGKDCINTFINIQFTGPGGIIHELNIHCLRNRITDY